MNAAERQAKARDMARQDQRNAERRHVAGLVLARLLGSRAACEEIKARADELRGTAPAPPFPVSAARAAITFAEALIDELDKREARGA
ncbi:MAG: hypothetical protein EHM24_31805 [Acidobacteria bacterium]|nr:MAG: hypothetical protein EHM24_31805 [Acidobacteriota bacterium]